jgi:hypothetical protein
MLQGGEFTLLHIFEVWVLGQECDCLWFQEVYYCINGRFLIARGSLKTESWIWESVRELTVQYDY